MQLQEVCMVSSIILLLTLVTAPEPASVSSDLQELVARKDALKSYHHLLSKTQTTRKKW